MAGGAAAGAAAAELRRRMLEEEEEMTAYRSDDLSHDWEFKIVRSNTGAFRKPKHLQRVVEQEAQAGWILLEKFDDSRLRFKRRCENRLNDARLPPGVDPYRVRYGMPTPAFVVLLLLTVLSVTGGLMALLFLYLRTHV